MKPTPIFATLFLLMTLTLSATARRDDRPRVAIETTEGTFVVALFNETPIHRDNFLKLARNGYYDSLLFHRVIRNFMVQAGDPDSRHARPGQALGEGGPGYTLPAEIRTPDLYHWRGALAAAREPDDVNPERRSSGSQFYIVWGRSVPPRRLAPIAQAVAEATDGQTELTPAMREDYNIRGGAPHLDGQYTVFGEVVEGLKVIKKMQAEPTDSLDRPLSDIRILYMRVMP